MSHHHGTCCCGCTIWSDDFTRTDRGYQVWRNSDSAAYVILDNNRHVHSEDIVDLTTSGGTGRFGMEATVDSEDNNMVLVSGGENDALPSQDYTPVTVTASTAAALDERTSDTEARITLSAARLVSGNAVSVA